MTKNSLLLITVTLCLQVISGANLWEKKPKQEFCRALSLSGGGAKGSFEAGALWQMARMLNGTDMEYDVLSGISVGAINAGGFAVYPKGQEVEATEFVR